MKTKIRNITFDGIESDLLTMMVDTPLEDAVEMPFDKFAWFYQRNGSAEYDGRFEMWTGKDDIQKVGQITKWKNASDLSEFFPSPCSTLTGSAGEFFPPNRDKTSISYFSPDLCRTIFFNYKEKVNVEGVHGYKYILDWGLVGNATRNNSNSCYNPHPDYVQQIKENSGEDSPDSRPIEGKVDLGLYDGLLNVTACKFNAPAYVSYPHFYMADPQLLESFHDDSDLHPNEAEHESYLSMIPKPGIPIQVSIRMQINVLLRSLKFVSILEDVETTMFPMIWFETSTQLDEDMVGQMKLLDFAGNIGNIFGGIFIGVGAILSAAGAAIYFRLARSTTCA